jgi:glucose/arabinose dehydrogenase
VRAYASRYAGRFQFLRPPGFEVELFVSNLRDPRTVRVAPNGDIFIAESEPGRIRVLRAADGAAKPSSNDVFASGLDQPFGIAFYPPGSDPQWTAAPALENGSGGERETG